MKHNERLEVQDCKQVKKLKRLPVEERLEQQLEHERSGAEVRELKPVVCLLSFSFPYFAAMQQSRGVFLERDACRRLGSRHRPASAGRRRVTPMTDAVVLRTVRAF